jgi:hypothetical protein
MDDTKGPKRPRGRPKSSRLQETLDDLEAFNKWKKGVLPKLEEVVAAAKTPDDIYKAFANDAAARAVMIAITSRDAGKAMSAITEILNRSQGKPVEQIQLDHKYEKLRDEELDALVLSVVNDGKGGKS